VNEDPCQTQNQLAETLNVTHAVIFKHLKAMGKIYKERGWVPYELKERNIKKRKTISEILLAR